MEKADALLHRGGVPQFTGLLLRSASRVHGLANIRSPRSRKGGGTRLRGVRGCQHLAHGGGRRPTFECSIGQNSPVLALFSRESRRQLSASELEIGYRQESTQH